MYHLLSLLIAFGPFVQGATVFQGECRDQAVICEQLCLAISPETYECGCFNDHSLDDDGVSCRLNATKSTARDRPTERLTGSPRITTPAQNDIVQLLPIDKDPPLRFNGKNYAELPADDSFYLESNVTIEFRLNSQADGILLFAGEFAGDDFFSIVFQAPNIILRFDCGEGAIEDLYRGPFKSGTWHSLTVHRKFCDYSDMKADRGQKMVDRTEQFKHYKGISVDKAVFLGGVPVEIDFLEGRSGASNGIEGCIRRVEINGRVHLDTRTGVNLAANREQLGYCTEVPPTTVRSIPAELTTEKVTEKAADSEEAPPAPTLTIKEIVLKTGASDDFLYKPTRPKPRFLAQLPAKPKKPVEKQISAEHVLLMGNDHKQTSLDRNASSPSPLRIVEFSGNSRVTLNLPEDIEDYLELVLYFKPSKNQGVIFTWSDAERYVVIALDEGFVNVHASMGVDAVALRSESVVSLHNWHKAEVWRSGKGILLKVDRQSWVEAEVHSARGPPRRMAILKGLATLGHPNEATPTHLLALHGFHGCIKRVVVNGHHQHLGELPAVETRECGSDPCAGSGCPGGCAARHDRFVCLCQWPTFGKKCAQNTTNSLEAMHFGGQSYLELSSDDYMQHITGDALRLVVEFKLANETNEFTESQILVFAGSEEDSGDFLKLTVTRERKIRFETNLGSGISELTHPTVIPAHRWTTVQVFREKRKIRMAINGDTTVSTVTPGTSEQLNVYRTLFIGGYESDSIHSEGLHGCVRMVELGPRLIRQPSDASTAINISECPL
ncbi:unnamed protein product, partial [Mesorhabditis spiculigera]